MSESRSLLGQSSARSSSARRINSTEASPSGTPSLHAHSIKLEDHRPGRRTTFSLLVGANTPGTISPPRSPTNGPVAVGGYQSSGYHSTTSSQPLSRPGSSLGNRDGSDVPATPYQFGDGTTGYRILFPTPEEDLDESGHADVARHVSIAIWLSLIVNIVLFASKTFSAVASRSLSVAASAVDSFLDLASQGIVFLAERGSKDHDSSLYPAGRSRLEPVGIILCAALMGMAALQLILESAQQLYQGYGADASPPEVSFDTFTVTLLVLTIVAKLALWAYCAAYAKYSPTLFALAVDHRNDVYSNVVALVAAMLAWQWSAAWSADPIGAILMSLYICMNWFDIGNEQIEMIVGRAADPEFIEEIRHLSATFHAQLVPDLIRAYHFGAKYLVELEVILPAEMTVREAHDISLALQQSIEQLPAVERAFVHVDYKGRDGEDEHNAIEVAKKAMGVGQTIVEVE